MFTAVLAIQALLGVLSEFKFFRNPAFMGLTLGADGRGGGERGRPPGRRAASAAGDDRGRRARRRDAGERAETSLHGQEEAQAAVGERGHRTTT